MTKTRARAIIQVVFPELVVCEWHRFPWGWIVVFTDGQCGEVWDPGCFVLRPDLESMITVFRSAVAGSN